MAPFYGWGATVSRLQSHYEERVYFLPLSPQEVLVLIWLNSEGWNAESTLEPPNSFEPGTPGLGIQRPNHQAIARQGRNCQTMQVSDPLRVTAT